MPRLIDADAFEVVTAKGVSMDFADGMQYVLEMIDKAPTIEAEPVKHGKWIKKRLGSYVCSECGLIHIPVLSKPNKRCPRCEAKMDGREKANE